MAAVAEPVDGMREPAQPSRKLNLECSACGYGIVRAEPPERCPMCQSVDAWDFAPWRPFSYRSSG